MQLHNMVGVCFALVLWCCAAVLLNCLAVVLRAVRTGETMLSLTGGRNHAAAQDDDDLTQHHLSEMMK